MPTLTIGSRSLFYDVAGPQGAPPIVLSNSLGTVMSMWDAQLPVLAKTHRVIRYDTRGHGHSTLQADHTLSLDLLADDIVVLLDHLGIERAHIAGLSLGGMTAQALAARRPERIASLVLMATSAFMGARDAWYARAALVRKDGTAAIADAIIERWFTPVLIQDSPEIIANYKTSLLAIDGPGYAACAEAIGDMDLRASNAGITIPTLILPGESDPATPVSMSEEIHRQISGSSLVVVPRAAHLLAVEQPEFVNEQLLRWLAKHP